jgi:hypothetical protein
LIEPFMLHTFLSAVLAAAQLCAAPVYLCLEADGSVCVDFGPAACDCCRHVPAEAACADESCSHADHEESGPVASAWFDPCDCEHVQIVEPQPATRERSNAPLAQPRSILIAVTASNPPSAAALASGAAEAPPPRVAPSATLLLLASVVIRR